jgi:dUTP pyrophosphatase
MTGKIHMPDEAFYFEPVTKYLTAGLPMPVRKTEMSAGYDMVVAEDIIIYPYESYMNLLKSRFNPESPVPLAEMAAMTKEVKAKPALVSTGMKCHMPKGYYLELSVRSSTPLKDWIILANGVGIIDADYYNNPDNEGEIFFQLINLSPFPIALHKGDIIGQGIIMPYATIVNDEANGVRSGGFGSTSNG